MKGIDQNLSINGLTCLDSRANMPSGEQPSYLENDISAQSTVQTTREFTTNGCHVRLVFKGEHDPQIRKDIARIMLTAFEQRKDVDV